MVRRSTACLPPQLHPPLYGVMGHNRKSGSSCVALKHLERVSCFPLGVLEQGSTDKGISLLRGNQCFSYSSGKGEEGVCT